MAIRDTSRKPYIEDNDTNIRVGIDLPIRRGNDKEGFFATTSTTIEAVKNNIRNLLQTNEGERFFQPNLGLNLRKLLFEHITNENLLGVQDAILDKIESLTSPDCFASKKLVAADILRNADFGDVTVSGLDRVSIEAKVEQFTEESMDILDSLRAFEVF